MATTDFRILGPLEVVDAGQLVRLAGARQRALLAILLLGAGEAISSDRPIDELWDEEPPDAGSAALRVRISQLRRLGPAGELVVTRPLGYALAGAPERVDLRASSGWSRRATGPRQRRSRGCRGQRARPWSVG